MTDQEKECAALNGDYNGMTATAAGTFNDRVYEVIGWHMDSNGCLKTYGEGCCDESFIVDTIYS